MSPVTTAHCDLVQNAVEQIKTLARRNSGLSPLEACLRWCQESPFSEIAQLIVVFAETQHEDAHVRVILPGNFEARMKLLVAYHLHDAVAVAMGVA